MSNNLPFSPDFFRYLYNPNDFSPQKFKFYLFIAAFSLFCQNCDIVELFQPQDSS